MLLGGLSAIIGWLGVAVTGADTSSNSLFGALQVRRPRTRASCPRLWPQRVLGKMISPQSPVICAAAVGMASQEGEIFFRKVSSAGASCSSS